MKEKAIKILDALLFNLWAFWFNWLLAVLFCAMGILICIAIAGAPGLGFIHYFIFCSFCFAAGYFFALCMQLAWGS